MDQLDQVGVRVTDTGTGTSGVIFQQAEGDCALRAMATSQTNSDAGRGGDLAIGPPASWGRRAVSNR